MKEVLISTCEKTFINEVIASNQVPNFKLSAFVACVANCSIPNLAPRWT